VSEEVGGAGVGNVFGGLRVRKFWVTGSTNPSCQQQC